MTSFQIKKVSENLALVEYPMLAGFSEIDLNLLANHLMQLGGSVMNVNIFVNNQPIHIVDLGFHGQHGGQGGGKPEITLRITTITSMKASMSTTQTTKLTGRLTSITITKLRATR